MTPDDIAASYHAFSVRERHDNWRAAMIAHVVANSSLAKPKNKRYQIKDFMPKEVQTSRDHFEFFKRLAKKVK